MGNRYTLAGRMRTNIEVDHALLKAAMKATRKPTRRATVEHASRRVVRPHRQMRAGEKLAGIGWDGDLDAMRKDWTA